MDIEGLSKETLKLFMQKELISNIPSIYQLHQKKGFVIKNYPDFNKNQFLIFWVQLKKSKTNSLNQLLFWFGDSSYW